MADVPTPSYVAGDPTRFFIEREVTREEFMAAEREAGFHAPEGRLATAGFSAGKVRGRVDWAQPCICSRFGEGCMGADAGRYCVMEAAGE